MIFIFFLAPLLFLTVVASRGCEADGDAAPHFPSMRRRASDLCSAAFSKHAQEGF
jgi:hypothetical protein